PGPGGVVGAGVGLGGDLPPVERRRAALVGVDAGAVIVGGAGLALGLPRRLVLRRGGPLVVDAGCRSADGVEVEPAVTRPAGDGHVARGGPELVAQRAGRRVG